MVLVHGAEDGVYPLNFARAIRGKAHSEGLTSDLMIIPDMGHNILNVTDNDEVMNSIAKRLYWLITKGA